MTPSVTDCMEISSAHTHSCRACLGVFIRTWPELRQWKGTAPETYVKGRRLVIRRSKSLLSFSSVAHLLPQGLFSRYQELGKCIRARLPSKWAEEECVCQNTYKRIIVLNKQTPLCALLCTAMAHLFIHVSPSPTEKHFSSSLEPCV